MSKKDIEKIDFPSEAEKEKSIAQIVMYGMPKPQRLGSALWELWKNLGLRGICFGVWDCILLALLLDGILWMAVYSAARYSPQMIGIMLFGASPLLYALLHVLTIWKEVMTGTYQMLMVCRLALRQMAVLRLLIFGGASVVLLSMVNIAFMIYFEEGLGYVFRMICLSVSALFFYAFLQLVLEWKWKSRMSYAAAPVLWCSFSIVLLMMGEYGQNVLGKIPTAAFIVCGSIFASLYLWGLRKYYFEIQEMLV